MSSRWVDNSLMGMSKYISIISLLNLNEMERELISDYLETFVCLN